MAQPGSVLTVPRAQQNMRSCGVHARAANMHKPSSRARRASRIIPRMLERYPDNPGYS
ncbi:hypothetical protein GIB67_009576 [Kingdonia uniflora]|uniref:Uncharacterized protein n=1 Tax=Kingdonia uniflora TaxID=39325 RepID=A0A7J7LXA6_9MAGN|nr:hypothetical protein GIB67_009576 [Kingdonia uniflora]